MPTAKRVQTTISSGWAADVRGQLDVLLSDPEFRASPRQRAFLRYVVEQTLAGHSDIIKATTIAIDVFGKDPTFDASADPLVRIEATRLRGALKRYYGASRRKQKLVFELPPGGYVPNFTSASVAPFSDAAPASPTPNAMRVRLTWAAAGIAVLALCTTFLLTYWLRSPPLSKRPTVMIELAPSRLGDTGNAEFRDELLFALSKFPTLQLNVAPVETETSRQYRVVLDYGSSGSNSSAAWQVFSGAGELLQTGQPIVAPSPKALVAKVAARLAGYRGAIPSIETRADLDNPTLGAGCVQRAVFSVAERLGAMELKKANECLRTTIAMQPGSPDAHAALTYVLLAVAPFESSRTQLDEALEHARNSVSLDSNSNRSATALMTALYHNRDIAAAIAEGRRAIELNPNEPAVKAYLGWVLFVSGRWKEGVELSLDAIETDPLEFHDSGSTLVLNSYRLGDYNDVVARTDLNPSQPSYMTLLTRLAALGRLGKLREADDLATKIRRSRPDFEKSFRNDMAARSLHEDLINRLAAGLDAAGIAIGPMTPG